LDRKMLHKISEKKLISEEECEKLPGDHPIYLYFDPGGRLYAGCIKVQPCSPTNCYSCNKERCLSLNKSCVYLGNTWTPKDDDCLGKIDGVKCFNEEKNKSGLCCGGACIFIDSVEDCKRLFDYSLYD
jgi:hypothetical protein